MITALTRRADLSQLGQSILPAEGAMSAPGGGWVDVTQTPVIVGPNKEATLLATGQVCLFRLRKL